MCEKCKAYLHDVTVFMLGNPILLLGVWTGHKVEDAIGMKIGVETFIFTAQSD
jgi:hypothetical protein